MFTEIAVYDDAGSFFARQKDNDELQGKGETPEEALRNLADKFEDDRDGDDWTRNHSRARR